MQPAPEPGPRYADAAAASPPLMPRDYGFLLFLLGVLSWIVVLGIANVQTASSLSERYNAAYGLAPRLSASALAAMECAAGRPQHSCLERVRAVLAPAEPSAPARALAFARCDRQLAHSLGALTLDVVVPGQPKPLPPHQADGSTPARLAAGEQLRLGICGPGFHVIPIASVAVQ